MCLALPYHICSPKVARPQLLHYHATMLFHFQLTEFNSTSSVSITLTHPTSLPLLPCCHTHPQGPGDSSASVLTHPLEEPLPVVADCSISSSSTGGGAGGARAAGRPGHLNIAALAGWSQERVVWSSRELPYVATYNEVRGLRSGVVFEIEPL